MPDLKYLYHRVTYILIIQYNTMITVAGWLKGSFQNLGRLFKKSCRGSIHGSLKNLQHVLKHKMINGYSLYTQEQKNKL